MHKYITSNRTVSKILALLLVQVNVTTQPSVPYGECGNSVCPGNKETLKPTLVMQHHSIARNYSMLNVVLFDPSAK